MIFCYLFELKSIQKYIFNSGKLRDVIASSERFAALLDEPLHNDEPASVLLTVLQQLDVEHNLIEPNATLTAERGFYIVRANGGALQILCRDKSLLIQFRALWTLTVSQLFPGINFVDTLHGAEHKTPLALINAGMQQMLGMRNFAKPMFPRPTAAIKTYPDTAESQVAEVGRLKAYQDGMDIATHNNANYMRNTHLQLLNKFTPTQKTSLSFAKSEEDIVAGSDNQDVALIHIDGNALGLVLQDVRNALAEVTEPRDFARKFRTFSRTIAFCTIESTRYAVNAIAPKDSTTLAMRPVVCGGDDVTVIINAGDALKFTQAFCKRFEKLTAQHIATLNKQEFAGAISLKKLSASAGILFQKSSQPFLTGAHLAEALCKLSKHTFKRHASSARDLPYSMLSYFRISTVYNTDLEDVREAATTLSTWPNNQHGLQLAASALVICCDKKDKPKIAQLPDVYLLEDVLKLAKGIKNKTAHRYFTLGKIRRMLTELSLGRWVNADDLIVQALDKGEVSAERAPLLETFNQLYEQTSRDSDFWYRSGDDERADQSVIFDIVTLAKFMPETRKEASDAV